MTHATRGDVHWTSAEKMMRRPLLYCVLCSSAAIAAILPAGCNILGPAAFVLSGPATIDAEFRLPDQPTVVFVDDRRNVLANRGIRSYLGDKTGEYLLRHKVLNVEKQHSIRTGGALAAARGDEQGHLLSLEEIGEKVGARQVIYIDMLTFQIETTDGESHTHAQFAVKVIDVETRTRIFPDPESGPPARTMVVSLPPERTYQPIFNRETRREAELALAVLIADKVSKIFYKHEPGTPFGSRVAPQVNPRAR